jgi:hypothetical protein
MHTLVVGLGLEARQAALMVRRLVPDSEVSIVQSFHDRSLDLDSRTTFGALTDLSRGGIVVEPQTCATVLDPGQGSAWVESAGHEECIVFDHVICCHCYLPDGGRWRYLRPTTCAPNRGPDGRDVSEGVVARCSCIDGQAAAPGIVCCRASLPR